MSTMTDLEAGKLIAAVEHLTAEVKTLNARIEDLEEQLNKGKGIMIGVFMAASGFGAAASAAFSKWLS